VSWWQLSRLGLVQAAIGAVVVLLTTTINRVIVVELSLPATVPVPVFVACVVDGAVVIDVEPLSRSAS
jgi:hypothetical protein